MKYKQMQMILEPTSIEKLYAEDADDDTLAEAMLFNWDHIGSLITEDDYWRCLFELSKDFLFDDVLNEYDNYKGWERRSLIIKVKNRYFCYNYISGRYDDDLYDCEEVYPVPCISYTVRYVNLNDPGEITYNPNKITHVSSCYKKLYGNVE